MEARLYKLLKLSKCVDCGATGPTILDFDHIGYNPKKFTISSSPRRGKKWKEIAYELSKCVTRCSLCHRQRTSEQQKWYTQDHHKIVDKELSGLTPREYELELLKLKIEILEIAVEVEKEELNETDEGKK